MIQKTDVIVVGGGPVGSAIAFGLDQAGLDVTLIDRQPAETLKAPEADGRGFAISYSSKLLLDTLGLWGELAPYAEPIQDIRVTNGKAPFYLHFDHKEVGENALGYLVESAYVRAGFAKVLSEKFTGQCLNACEAVSYKEYVDHIKLELSDGQQIETKLIIAADGKNSTMRELAGIGTFGWSYKQTAIVCSVTHPEHHQGVAHEHFMSSGPFAVLPLKGGHSSSIVWTEKEALAGQYIGMSEEDFSAEMTRRFPYLGPLTLSSKRWSYPLSTRYTKRYFQGRIALVGDAAHAIHPLAGQGMNVGFRDVAALAELIVDHGRLGLDIGSQTLLRRYERKRYVDSLTYLAATDMIDRVYASRSKVVRKVLGTAALAASHGLPIVRRKLMRGAMGLSCSNPRLLQGEPL